MYKANNKKNSELLKRTEEVKHNKGDETKRSNTINFETFILHQLCSLLKHSKPSVERKTNGAENFLFEAARNSDRLRPDCFAVIEFDANEKCERRKKSLLASFFSVGFIMRGAGRLKSIISWLWLVGDERETIARKKNTALQFYVEQKFAQLFVQILFFSPLKISIKSVQRCESSECGLRWIATFILFPYKNAC